MKDKVRQQLAATQAAALADKLGAERLAKARAAPTEPLAGTDARRLARPAARPAAAAARRVLKAPVATLPAFVGVSLGDQGYAVAKIIKTAGRDPVVADPAQGDGAVRAGLGRRRGAGLLRGAEDRASR